MAALSSPPTGPSNVTVVVFDGNQMHDWISIFSGQPLSDGRGISVVQCSWNDISVSLYPSGCLCTIAPIRESGGKKKPETVTVKPDFLVIRNQPRGPTPATDNRNALYALVAAGIPAVNSLQSCMLDLERASMVGEMLRLQRLAPSPAHFPVIPISFYSHCMRMPMYDSGFPAILKVSHAHAGMGKVKIASSEGLHDCATVLALHADYASLEPYVPPFLHGIFVTSCAATSQRCTAYECRRSGRTTGCTRRCSLAAGGSRSSAALICKLCP